MKFYKAILQYDGTDRMGFQFLENKPTIQGDLNSSLEKILKGEFSTRAASRTDKGVHAFAQVVKISAEDPSPLDAAQINNVLPSFIRCLELSPCVPEFIPSIDQQSKEYCYLFSETAHERFIAKAPTSLNISHMKSCVEMLKGTNDFKNFWSIGGISNTTVREILECDLTLIDPNLLFNDSMFNAGDISLCWQFRIVGKGFLKHMVRHLVGALWTVGSGKLSVDEFQKLLQGQQKEQRPWKKADPRGLYLMHVNY